MEKILDLEKNVYDLCNEYPNLIEIMKDLGFENITGKGMLNTVGRFVTIPKGAVMKNISLEHIKSTFVEHGFTIKE